MPTEIELQMMLALIGLSFPALIGIYKVFAWFRDHLMVRRGYVGMELITSNRGLKKTFGKPDGDTIKLGKNKLYKFTPKKLYRRGSVPTGLWNEDSIDMLDPLSDEKTKGLDSNRLSELLIRWYNLGVISTMSKEKILMILVIVAAVAAVGALGISFVTMQSLSTMDGSLVNIGELIKQIPGQIVATQNATVLG